MLTIRVSPLLIVRAILIVIVMGYRLIGSPIMRWRGVRCLRIPTCSEYALLALKRYPVPRAVKMIRQRIYECRLGTSRGFIDYP